MLSFTDINNDSLPIARVEYGDKNGQILYLHDKTKITPEIKKASKKNIDIDEIYNFINTNKKGKRFSIDEREKMRDSLAKYRDGGDFEDIEEKKEEYKQMKKYLDSKSEIEVSLHDDSKFRPLPNINLNRSVYYIAGASGSGKTFFCSILLKEYKKLFPDKKIYIFSRVQYDKVLDDLKPIRILLDESIVDDPIDAEEELADSICVFDDIDTITDKEIRESIQQLRDTCLEVGRHTNIDVFTMSHQLFNYKLTRLSLIEAHYVVMFKGTGAYHITRYLKQYLGWTKDQIQKLLNSPSRWYMVYTQFPQFVLTEHDCWLIK